jgi:tetratricopeptide (TPR) repeat protein
MQGNATGAVEAYEKSLDLEPSRSAYSNLASAYYYAGRFREAVATYVKAARAAPNDQTLWGNLADAQWQLADARQDARESYERAIRLAERDLGLGPPGPLLLAQLGYYHARIGDCSRGRQYITEAGAGGSDQMYVQYFTSLVAADCADPAALQRAAAAAVRLGYPQALLDIDPALKGKLGEPAAATG